MIKIITERLIITPASLEEMKGKYNSEPDAEMKKAYSEMIDLMNAFPGREEWTSDWSIRLKTGETVGGIGFKGPPGESGDVEIGYGIDEEFQNRGFATEAAGALAEWALSQPSVKRVLAQTEPGNATSKRVLAKNGFTPCGMGAEGPLFQKKS